MPIWRTTSRNNSIRKTVRKGSVLNVTRRNAALNKIRASNNYGNAIRAGLNNAGAQNYYARIQQWHSGMPKYSPGQHQNNAAAAYHDWELTNPKPLLPGETPDADLASRIKDYRRKEQEKAERNMREQYGHFDGGRKSRKGRKNRR